MECKIDIDLLEKDYTQFNLFVSNRYSKPIMLIYFIFLTLIIYDICSDLLVSTMMSLLASVAIWFLLRVIHIFFAGAAYRSNKLLQHRSTVYADNSGIREMSDASDLRITFENIYMVRESKHAIYIFIARNAAIIVPKRILNADNEKVLRTLLRANIDSSKMKLTEDPG